jgi:helicase
MELHEYLAKKEKDLDELLRSPSFRNQYGQIFAKKMGAKFNATYQEDTIWGYAIFLSSASTKVLLHKSSAVCEYALKVAAELFETLSLMSEHYDREYARILAALCYDAAGYQANAQCMLKFNYALEGEDPLDTSTNQLIQLVTRLLEGRLQSISSIIRQPSTTSEIGEMESYWKKGIEGFVTYQLFGDWSNYVSELSVAKRYAMSFNDTILTSILSLLELKFLFSYQRTTWTVLKNEVSTAPDVWRPYLRLLSMNPYNNNQILPPPERISHAELWKSQIIALHKGLLEDNRGFIIQMPTSAGKTLIAELAILQQVGKRRKCLYIAPFRALVNEVESALSKHLSRLGYLVSSLSGSYELDEFDQFWIREADVLVATPEKVDFLMRLNPELFQEVALIVIDEGHVLGNLDKRSAQFELLLTRLKRIFVSREVRFLFISAVMPDHDSSDFAKWLLENEQAKIQSPMLYDQTTWQPTRRLLGIFEWLGDNGQVEFNNYVRTPGGLVNRFFIPNFIKPLRYQTVKGKKTRRIINHYFPNNKSQTAALLAYRYLREGSVLVFCGTVGRRKGGGVYSVLRAFNELIGILDSHFGSELHFPHVEDSEAVEAAIRWYGEEHIITQCLRRGVAPHFGDLAEEVRRAVEREYAEKKLKILVSTSTLGQGVNLPIKTILVYSLDMNPNPQNPHPIKIRDFWNIVGRAGRAGRETEGQIVFLKNTRQDIERYVQYSNLKNAERVRSIFTVAMELFRQRRLSQSVLEQIIGDLLEPALMTFLIEEVVDTPDQALIESFIGDTLFKIQSNDEDVEEVSRIIMYRANRFWNVETKERKEVFAKTGLSLTSCETIELILRQEERLVQIMVDGDLECFIRLSLECLSHCEEMKPKEALDEVSVFGNERMIQFILAWVSGKDLNELRHLWTEAAGEAHLDLMNVFIEDCLCYRFPWGVTAVLLIACFILNMELNDLSLPIKNLPSCIKYGLNDKKALWLRGIGIQSRETCLVISDHYNGDENIRSFGKWFISLTKDEFVEMGITSRFTLQNILNVSSRLSFQGPYSLQSQSVYRFRVKGVTFDSQRVEAARAVKVGDRLILKREPENEYDSFAIQVLHGENQLGYVPRELAKYFSFQIDIMFREIECTVEKKKGNTIIVAARLLHKITK